MDRRSFLTTTGAAGLGAAAGAQPVEARADLAAPGITSGIRDLRVACAWPEAVAGPADDARRLLTHLVEASDGKWRFHVVDVGTGDTPIGMAAQGAADLTIASDNDHTGIDPAFGFFGGLPGELGIAFDDMEAWLVAGGGQILWDDLAGHYSIKPLLAGHLGAPAGLWSCEPIRAPGDLAGRRVVANGLAVDVARGLGAEAVIAGTAAASDAPIIQGAGLVADLALGMPARTRHYYTHGLAPAGSTVTLGVARRLWDTLSGTERAILAGAASMAWRECLAMQKIHARIALDALQRNRSVSIGSLCDEVVRQIDRVSEAVVAHAAGSSPRARAIDASLLAYLRAAGRNLSVQPVA